MPKAPTSRPFSIGYAYAQTEHYRQAVAAARETDPFNGIETTPEPVAEVPAPVVDGPTAPMVRYAMALMDELLGGMTDEVRAAAEAKLQATPKREVHTMIGRLKADVEAKRKARPVRVPAPRPATATVEEGMYRDPATGDIYKVQIAHHGSGKPYAKKLVKLDTVKTKGKKEYSHDFEYAPGAINRIQAAWRMTKEEAVEWGQLYGACCRCGTILTDERSIEAGIGPVCSGKI